MGDPRAVAGDRPQPDEDVREGPRVLDVGGADPVHLDARGLEEVREGAAQPVAGRHDAPLLGDRVPDGADAAGVVVRRLEVHGDEARAGLVGPFQAPARGKQADRVLEPHRTASAAGSDSGSPDAGNVFSKIDTPSSRPNFRPTSCITPQET